MTLSMKTCTKCGRELPMNIEYFLGNKKAKDGFNYYCRECNNEISRRWRNENKESVSKSNKKYRSENKEYYKDYCDDYCKQWNKENKDYFKEYNREYYQNNKEYYIQWRKDNPGLDRNTQERRRARKNNLPHSFTEKDWQICKKYFKNSCAYCGITEQDHLVKHNQVLHQDHFIPLSKGGGYIIENIVPACRSCNCSKNDRNFKDWYPTYEFYNKQLEDIIFTYLEGYNKYQKLII